MDICEKAFNEEKFGPVVESLRQRLEPEIEIRAKLTGQNPQEALAEFRGHISSFHRQLDRRRKFILSKLSK
jgi:hypothetical protein